MSCNKHALSQNMERETRKSSRKNSARTIQRNVKDVKMKGWRRGMRKWKENDAVKKKDEKGGRMEEN